MYNSVDVGSYHLLKIVKYWVPASALERTQIMLLCQEQAARVASPDLIHLVCRVQ